MSIQAQLIENKHPIFEFVMKLLPGIDNRIKKQKKLKLPYQNYKKQMKLTIAHFSRPMVVLRDHAWVSSPKNDGVFEYCGSAGSDRVRELRAHTRKSSMGS